MFGMKRRPGVTGPSTARSQQGGRGPLRLLVDRNFGPFFVGRVTSSLGIWVQNITAALVMWDITRSAFLVGTVSVMQFMGPLLLSMWVGALSDRFDRRIMLLAGRVISGVAALGLCLGATLPPSGLRPGWILFVAGVLGIGLAVSSPSMHALIPGLVPEADLDQAVAMNSMVGSIARAFGPALGAMFVVAGGPALAFAFSTFTHFAFALALALISSKPQGRTAERQRVMGGLRYVASSRATWSLLLGVATLSFGIDPVITLTPALAAELGGGSEAVGVLASSFGVGAVVMAMAMRILRRHVGLRTLGISGFATLALGLAVIAGGHSVTVGVVGFLLAGAGFLLGSTTANTRIQRRVPDRLRGRVMGLWTIAFLGSRPVAAAVNGMIADVWSVRAALSMGAAIALASTLLMNVRFGLERQ